MGTRATLTKGEQKRERQKDTGKRDNRNEVLGEDPRNKARIEGVDQNKNLHSLCSI